MASYLVYYNEIYSFHCVSFGLNPLLSPLQCQVGKAPCNLSPLQVPTFLPRTARDTLSSIISLSITAQAK